MERLIFALIREFYAESTTPMLNFVAEHVACDLRRRSGRATSDTSKCGYEYENSIGVREG
jgi:hypothetical protein